jgi:hypothetical protein
VVPNNGTNGAAGSFTAPYVSFKTLLNLLDKLDEDGAPQRIDRTYLSNLPGSTQSMLLTALDTFGLIDGSKRPTDHMKALVAADAEQRATLIGELVRAHYGPALDLGDNATQGQLEEVFTDNFNVSGSTRRKSIAFFLAATKYAGITVSKHFKTPKAASAGGAGRRRKGQAGGGKDEDDDKTPPSPPTPASDPKSRYIDLLLKKAGEEDNLDADLLNRIERVIGVPASEPSDPDEGNGGDR